MLLAIPQSRLNRLESLAQRVNYLLLDLRAILSRQGTCYLLSRYISRNIEVMYPLFEIALTAGTSSYENSKGSGMVNGLVIGRGSAENARLHHMFRS